MPGEFQGKVAVITGGSRGIGRGIAVALAKEGAQTVLVSSSKSNLDAAAKTVGGGRRTCTADDRRPISRRWQAASRCSTR